MRTQTAVRAATCVFVFLALVVSGWAQQHMSSLDRGRALEMLKVISGDVRKHYYDSKFHGVDFDAKVTLAKQRIESASSFNMAMSHIAAALDSLNDSHTFLIPPQHAYRHDYGFQYQIVGERCFITQIRPKSDAEIKGVTPGDEVISINGYKVVRENVGKIYYLFSILRPQLALRLVLQDPSGVQRQVDVTAKLRDKKRVMDLTRESGANDILDLIHDSMWAEFFSRARYRFKDQLVVLKVPEFSFSREEVRYMIGEIRKYPNAIVDLRGNPGGSVETLKYLVGGIFDKDVKLGDRVGRKETKPEIAKSDHNPFSGKLVVLVDSRSASAAEILARVVQLEKRGVVIGDRTSGSVMEARAYGKQLGADTVIFDGAMITEWDLIMADGKSLEHTGVTPDEIILPSAEALAKGTDPVLARAAEMLGITVSAEEAGKAFPYEWPPE